MNTQRKICKENLKSNIKANTNMMKYKDLIGSSNSDKDSVLSLKR